MTAALALVVTLTGCAGGKGPQVPGELTSTVEGVAFYPACGNEVLVHEGVTWYPYMPQQPDNAGGGPDGGMGGGNARLAPLPTVAAPGPGDDVGTLSFYDNGAAFWESDSGEIWTWLTTVPQTYNWVC